MKYVLVYIQQITEHFTFHLRNVFTVVHAESLDATEINFQCDVLDPLYSSVNYLLTLKPRGKRLLFFFELDILTYFAINAITQKRKYSMLLRV